MIFAENIEYPSFTALALLFVLTDIRSLFHPHPGKESKKGETRTEIEQLRCGKG
jgi:hypothetical protein